MNNELFKKEAINIWSKVAARVSDEQLHLELEVYKKLLNFVQVGDYFFWVFNIGNYSMNASQEVQRVLGYSPSEFTIACLMENVHPDDRGHFLNFENKASTFFSQLPIEKLMKYKIRHDFRLKKKDGTYVRLLHQSIVLEHDESGQILRTFGSETDITHLKTGGKPSLSIIGFDDEPSYINVDAEQVFKVTREVLSKREKQILLLIMDGKLSKEIARILHISKQTVDTHRNNMIERNKVKNTSELIAKAIRNGWL